MYCDVVQAKPNGQLRVVVIRRPRLMFAGMPGGHTRDGRASSG